MIRRALPPTLLLVLVGCGDGRRALTRAEIDAATAELVVHLNDKAMTPEDKVAMTRRRLGKEHRTEGPKQFWYGRGAGQSCWYVAVSSAQNSYSGGTTSEGDCAKYAPAAATQS
jgi:hypothetical protein